MSYHFTCSVLTISVVCLIPSSILLISLSPYSISLSPYSISLHPLTLLFHSVHLHLTGLRCINFLFLNSYRTSPSSFTLLILPYISFFFHSLSPYRTSSPRRTGWFSVARRVDRLPVPPESSVQCLGSIPPPHHWTGHRCCWPRGCPDHLWGGSPPDSRCSTLKTSSPLTCKETHRSKTTQRNDKYFVQEHITQSKNLQTYSSQNNSQIYGMYNSVSHHEENWFIKSKLMRLPSCELFWDPQNFINLNQVNIFNSLH